MEGLYLKMTDVYDVIEKLCANGTLSDYQRLMIEVEIDGLDYYTERQIRQRDSNRPRHCDCCGVLLTEENNTCGYELCDECNEELERYIAEKENRRNMSEIPTGSESE